MERNEIIKTLKDNLIIRLEPSNNLPGGQQVGVTQYSVVVECEELDASIKIGYHKSQLKNKELALSLMDLVIDDLIK